MGAKKEISAETPRLDLQGVEPEGSILMHIEDLDGILLDLDGVMTETAQIHAEAWKTMFDVYLRERAARNGGALEPFDANHDYRKFVDGKPRYDGVASFLQSRGIDLPLGEESDPPEKETVCGLGNRKNRLFLDAIRQRGVKVYRTSIEFIKRARLHGFKIAVVTASRNGREVLDAAGLGNLFDAEVDGIVAHERKLAGKPAPDTFVEAARRLEVSPDKAAVIEDAAAGVKAGKAGGFGLVIGISRNGQPELLRENGADIVVSDLSELRLGREDRGAGRIAPLAVEKMAEVSARIAGRRIVVFLDYDGTLTPIVERPELAVLPDKMRTTLKVLAELCTVCVVSGRMRSDVEHLVGLDSLTYAGSHGFDIVGPQGTKIQHEVGEDYVPILEKAARELRSRLASVRGVIVEGKVFAVAVHFRMVAPREVSKVERAVDDVLAQHPALRKTGGKKVFELRPNINWDKGKAVLWLLDALGLNRSDVVPFYIGDDVTDRDAFQAIRGKGISILVSEEAEFACADYRLSDTTEVGTFLDELIALISEKEE
jgi:trehalose 6-phosphate phosphatase